MAVAKDVRIGCRRCRGNRNFNLRNFRIHRNRKYPHSYDLTGQGLYDPDVLPESANTCVRG
ncbi:hypothetical protein D3C73_1595390 [compost metagenome]